MDVESDERGRDTVRDRPPPRPPPPHPPPLPLLGPAIGLVLLGAALYFTMDAFHRWDRLQACVTAGRRDCGR